MTGYSSLSEILFNDVSFDKYLPSVKGSLNNYYLGCYEPLDKSRQSYDLVDDVANSYYVQCEKICLANLNQVSFFSFCDNNISHILKIPILLSNSTNLLEQIH